MLDISYGLARKTLSFKHTHTYTYIHTYTYTHTHKVRAKLVVNCKLA